MRPRARRRARRRSRSPTRSGCSADSAGSGSTSLRRRETCTSIARSNTSWSRPRASIMSFSRASGWRGCCTNTLQQRELAGGQRGRRAVALERARREIEDERAERHPARLQRRARRRAIAMPPQHRVDARDQLARVEGLGQVVVGAHLEADDAVDLLALGREHDDGHVLPGAAQPPANAEAVLAGQHEVEHDQVRRVALQPLVEVARVGDGARPRSPARRGSG